MLQIWENCLQTTAVLPQICHRYVQIYDISVSLVRVVVLLVVDDIEQTAIFHCEGGSDGFLCEICLCFIACFLGMTFHDDYLPNIGSTVKSV